MENSIEYLINEVSAILTDTHLNSMQYLLLADALKRAREKHKEEIIKAHNEGIWHKEKCFDEGEQYYNQIYNQNK
jgi:hypothetical protein